jgi:transcriptional regulator with XRE-family HTH domain
MSARIGLDARQRKLASELRRLRELALLTADEVAQRLQWSASKISRIENARIRLRSEDVERLLDLYGRPTEQRAELLDLVGEPGRKKWWDAYGDSLTAELLTLISLEDDAVAAQSVEPMIVSGLLQTEEYAREILGMWRVLTESPSIHVERKLEARLRRQQVLFKEVPLRLHVVMDEAALFRKIGDHSVMRGQISHLLEISMAPNIVVQIFPLAGAHEVMAVESFMLLDIPDFQPVLCVENTFDSSIHIEDADRVHNYSQIFDGVRQAACSAEDSRRLIEQAGKDLWAA